MARKSRKACFVVSDNNTKIYNTALYVRLSLLDGNKDNSNSIENQEELLRNYIKDKDEFKIFSIYIDNGESGVNFDRPEFDRLINDVRNKKVNCIIVKDLSRFGRNYIETGEYLEKIFPFLNVRFIAITDNYDNSSENSLDDLSMHLLNLTNDIYAKDISKKIGVVLEEKQKNGEFIGSFAPYGYLKSSDNKNKLVIDNEIAYVIKKMFELRATGNSYAKIVEWLESNNIPTPRQYQLNKGIVKSDKWLNSKWNDRTVKNMLENQVYIGNMVQGKVKQSLFQGDKKSNIELINWFKAQNTHEPIIDNITFYKVQSINKEVNKKYKNSVGKYDYIGSDKNIFESLVYCGNCDKVLKRYKSVNVSKVTDKYKVKYFYICQNHSRDIESCSFISISEEELKERVLEVIKENVVLFGNVKEFLKYINFDKNRENELSKLDVEISRYRLELERLKEKKSQWYDKLLKEIILREEYVEFANKCRNEELVINDKIKKLENKALKIQKKRPLKTLEQIKVDNLSKELVEALIFKIVIFDRDRIEINFKNIY